MKPAYIISAYKRPDLLIRLVESLSPNPVSIHVDKKSVIFDSLAQHLASRSNVTFLPRHTCYWGMFGHVQASLEGMRWFTGIKADYAILLTGQCYPLKSNHDIEVALDALQGKSVIETKKFPVADWENDRGGYKRLDRFYFSANDPLYRKLRPFDVISRELGPDAALAQVRHVRLWKRKPPLGLHPYGGSGYWCLSRRCVEYILGYLRLHPEVERFFSTTFIPDEMFFQTVLANSPCQKELINSTIHYMDWSEGKSHPAVLGRVQVAAAIASGAWFARKFEDIDTLDHIDRLCEQCAFVRAETPGNFLNNVTRIDIRNGYQRRHLHQKSRETLAPDVGNAAAYRGSRHSMGSRFRR